MAGPDLSNGAVSNACSLLDMVPTLLDVAGGREPEPALPPAGRSLWESATGGHDAVDEATCEYTAEMASHPMFMIRRGRHKYIHCDSDPTQLYDVEADPLERDNLADDPEHRQLTADFATEVARRWDSTAIREQVLASQRTRRLLNAAMQTGEPVSWDYSPTRDASNEYVRNHMDWSEAGARHRFPSLH
jgi:choline-sulfatase